MKSEREWHWGAFRGWNEIVATLTIAAYLIALASPGGWAPWRAALVVFVMFEAVAVWCLLPDGPTA